MPNTYHVQLPNVIVLKSIYEGNLQINALPKESTKAHIFPHITYGALISEAQLCDHVCISIFANTYVAIYNKKMGPQMKVPQDSSTGIWIIDLTK